MPGMLKSEPGNIVEHQHLPVAIGPGADTDCWNAQPAGDHGCQFTRNGLQHQRENAGVLQRLGIRQKFIC